MKIIMFMTITMLTDMMIFIVQNMMMMMMMGSEMVFALPKSDHATLHFLWSWMVMMVMMKLD